MGRSEKLTGEIFIRPVEGIDHMVFHTKKSGYLCLALKAEEIKEYREKGYGLKALNSPKGKAFI